MHDTDSSKNRPNERGAQKPTVIYLDTNGTSTPPIYGTGHTLSTTPIMTMQKSMHREGPNRRSLQNDFPTVSTFGEKVKYCLPCLVPLHCASTRPLFIHTPGYFLINPRHNSLASILPIHSYRPGNQNQRLSWKPTPNAYLLGNRSPERNGGTIPNTCLPKNSIPRNSDGPEILTLASISAT